MTRSQVEEALQIPVNIVKSGGHDLVNAVLKIDSQADILYDLTDEEIVYQGYELKEI